MIASTRWVSLALLLGGAGCISTNGLHTARTVPRGRYEIHAAPQAHLANERDGLQGGGGTMVGVRVGAGDDVDIGAQVSMLQLRVEARWRLLDSEHFAFALAPAVAIGAVNLGNSDLTTFVGAGGLGLLTWSPVPDLSFNVVGGAEVGLVTDDATAGALSRQGVGIRWWVNDVFALHPEVISVTDIERDFAFVDMSAALGFVFAPGRR